MDGNREHLEAKLKVLKDNIDVEELLAFFHVGERSENPHCHFVLKTRSEIQKQSIAERMKKLFVIEGEKARSQYAIDVWDGTKDGGAVAYMFHEENAPMLINKGFSDQDLDRARMANEAVKKVVAVNKDRASQKLVERALEHFKDSSWKPDKKEILCFMLKEIKAGKAYFPGSYRLKSFVEEVGLKLTHDDNMEEYAEALAYELWR